MGPRQQYQPQRLLALAATARAQALLLLLVAATAQQQEAQQQGRCPTPAAVTRRWRMPGELRWLLATGKRSICSSKPADARA
jgi:hypothetical protein